MLPHFAPLLLPASPRGRRVILSQAELAGEDSKGLQGISTEEIVSGTCLAAAAEGLRDQVGLQVAVPLCRDYCAMVASADEYLIHDMKDQGSPCSCVRGGLTAWSLV